MEQVIYNEIIPPLVFFIIFSITFSLLELVLIFFLNRLEQKHWEFMIDVVIRSKVHHGKLIKYLTLIILTALVVVIVTFTPLIDVLVSASQELKLFALLLPLVMFLVYSINIRRTIRIAIEKKIYETIFFIVSLVLYVFILVLANESYGNYAQYLQANLIQPTVESVETVAAEKQEERLLNKFRESYMNNECVYIDYTKEEEEKGKIIKNFILIANEPELAYGDSEINFKDPTFMLKGKACSDGENTFLLTEHGNWYWVIEEYLR